MRTQIYRHTQIGYVMIVALAIPLIILATVLVMVGGNVMIGFVFAFLLLSLAMAATLTVEVTSEVVEARFGPGLIRRRIPVAQIDSCKAVTNRWWYGWGIRLYPSGWMFNVSGLRAVELQMKNGKRFRIGTDEPEQLVRAIEYACQG